MTVRVAAIDCGTNSIRLLVADLDPATGAAVDVDRQMKVVRLGQDVDRTGRLAPDALARTFAALHDYSAVIDDLGVDRIRMVSTSATRDAANREEFTKGVEAILGVAPQVIAGAEEAALTFDGATRGLVHRGFPTPYLVVDIGGGSTEFVLGAETVVGPRSVDIKGGASQFVFGADSVVASRSVDIGCVRMSERHLHTDPPPDDQVVAALADIEAGLDLAAAIVPLSQGKTLVAVAGTATTIAALALGLPAYDPDAIHLSRISAADVRRVAYDLRTMPRDARSALPVMHPGRVDVIVAGALILEAIVDRTGVAEIVVSEHDILDGIACSCLT